MKIPEGEDSKQDNIKSEQKKKESANNGKLADEELKAQDSKDEQVEKEKDKDEKELMKNNNTEQISGDNTAKQQVHGEEKMKELEEIIKKQQEQIDAFKNQYLRVRADFENYRKRTQKQIKDIQLYAGEQLIKDILPIIDNMERALESTENKEDALYKGILMIYQQFKNVLEKYGVSEIVALGKPFDPKYHEAIMTVKNEKYDTDTVAEVMQKGYIYHSKVIRPSMVKVAKN